MEFHGLPLSISYEPFKMKLAIQCHITSLTSLEGMPHCKKIQNLYRFESGLGQYPQKMTYKFWKLTSWDKKTHYFNFFAGENMSSHMQCTGFLTYMDLRKRVNKCDDIWRLISHFSCVWTMNYILKEFHRYQSPMSLLKWN